MDFDISAAKDRRRTGIPTSLALHDMGLYTMIGRGRKDARGQVLDVCMLSTMASHSSHSWVSSVDDM